MSKVLKRDARTVLERTLWGPELERALFELRTRHPEASFEIAGVESALALAAREIEACLLGGSTSKRRHAATSSEFHSGGGMEMPEDNFGEG